MIIAIDFDGTITKEHRYPRIGVVDTKAIEVISTRYKKTNSFTKFSLKYLKAEKSSEMSYQPASQVECISQRSRNSPKKPDC